MASETEILWPKNIEIRYSSCFEVTNWHLKKVIASCDHFNFDLEKASSFTHHIAIPRYWIYNPLRGKMKTRKKIKHIYVTVHPKIQGGEPVIRGTRTTVRAIAQYILRQGIPAEPVAKEFQISLAAIYGALSFYYAYRPVMDRLIERQFKEAA